MEGIGGLHSSEVKGLLKAIIAGGTLTYYIVAYYLVT